MGHRILVIEDDQSIAEIVGILLRGEGFEVSYCADGLQAITAFKAVAPDLVLLDLMLPGRDGIDVCRAIRESSGVPIVMLTARSDSADVVTGLESGADDYIVKPIKNEELLARIRARLRSIETPILNEIQIGDLVIDIAGHSVKRGSKEISLTVLEFKLLLTLAKRPWQVFSRELLLEEVWEYQHAAGTRLVNVHVQRLRAKIEIDPDHPEIVVTVRGVGYKAGQS
ncbi:MAG: response regulator [Actinobacteria bacterium]|uniref:DNA-binding response regulator MtrA n=1 Tax=freshwater metagenome TaxID=449393 RepID=A0A6J7BLJ3_9ZZZZ|nr:response regulator [Actinomycetota bacterium]